MHSPNFRFFKSLYKKIFDLYKYVKSKDKSFKGTLYLNNSNDFHIKRQIKCIMISA